MRTSHCHSVTVLTALGLLTCTLAATAGDRLQTAEVAAQQQAQMKGAAIAAIAANRDGAISALVGQWETTAGALGYPVGPWATEFSAMLAAASNEQLLAVQGAADYDAVRAILQGRSAPVSSSSLAGIAALGDTSGDLLYTPVTPCRILDTRFDGDGSTQVPAGATKNFYVYGLAAAISAQGGNAAGCPAPKGEPAGMAANFTSIPSTTGHIRVFPYSAPLPTASFLNFQSTGNLANAGIIATCYGCAYDLSVYNNVVTHYLADVMGYFYPADLNDVNIAEVGDVLSFAGTAPNVLPTGTPTFVGPTVSVTVDRPSQKITVDAHHALGSTTGGTALSLWPCYRITGSGAPPTTVGGGMFDLTVPAGQRHAFSVAGVVSGLAVNSYEVGMCAQVSDNSWNNNDWGYVKAMVVK
jgi:hypothetical protein